ncbi:MAG: acetyl-CoA carboxylase, biotin carboxyl carrier protein [Firmicutes bacterium]|nr:acetyl-CoA carboxylase, biotin carboxyl carrier protein [Bacillota bacterium]
MDENHIRKYASLMKELDLTGLEITYDENKSVRLERAGTNIPAAQTIVSAATESVSAPVIENTDYISVKSPVVGVFYAAPAENAEPFVHPGQKVEKGTTLCIIEAMKLMNEIHAEESGTIEKICVTNGQVVEYGTELFRIKR